MIDGTSILRDACRHTIRVLQDRANRPPRSLREAACEAREHAFSVVGLENGESLDARLAETNRPRDRRLSRRAEDRYAILVRRGTT